MISATAATADLSVDFNATPGPRDVTVTTGAQNVTLAGGFTIQAAPPTRLVSSPARGEVGVSLTRETIIRFSYPLSSQTTIDTTKFYASFGGQVLPGHINLSGDRKTATLFYNTPLPASARVRITVLGDQLLDVYGRTVDGDGDGQPGGAALIDFDTISLTPLPGTKACGTVYASELDPGPNGGTGNTPLAGVRSPWMAPKMP